MGGVVVLVVLALVFIAATVYAAFRSGAAADRRDDERVSNVVRIDQGERLARLRDRAVHAIPPLSPFSAGVLSADLWPRTFPGCQYCGAETDGERCVRCGNRVGGGAQ